MLGFMAGFLFWDRLTIKCSGGLDAQSQDSHNLFRHCDSSQCIFKNFFRKTLSERDRRGLASATPRGAPGLISIPAELQTIDMDFKSSFSQRYSSRVGVLSYNHLHQRRWPSSSAQKKSRDEHLPIRFWFFTLGPKIKEVRRVAHCEIFWVIDFLIIYFY